jgi:hypothetical protein
MPPLRTRLAKKSVTDALRLDVQGAANEDRPRG